jgi:hypothetical protein
MHAIPTGAAAKDDRAAQTRAARDRRQAAVLADGSLAWLLDEHFDAARYLDSGSAAG